MSDTSPAKLLLTAKEAARLLSISPRTLWSLTQSGVIPCVRWGRLVRYRYSTLEAVLAAREKGDERQ